MRRQSANLFLDALSERDRRRVLAQSETVEVRSGDIICSQGHPTDYVYFPAGAAFSLLVDVPGRPAFEVAVVGAEGAVGVTLATAPAIAALRVTVHSSGRASRMPIARFLRAMQQHQDLRSAVGRYLDVLLRQIAQMSVCTRWHRTEGRLARWLLIMRDLALLDDIRCTQQLIALRLGVRRVSVTRAAGLLRRRGLIQYSRGHVVILDRRGLRAVACPCYVAAWQRAD